MNRRAFLSLATCLTATKYLNAAVIPLGASSPMGQLMRAFAVNPKRELQSCQFWCWAASIAMIFESHGYHVAQDIIAQQSFNSPIAVCIPANTNTMGNALSRSWVDSNGIAFNSQVTAAYDYFNGFFAINNMVIVNELTNNRPLLYANTHHAMVIVAVDYFLSNNNLQIISVGVLDPWPGSPAFHTLTLQEMYPANSGGEMTFLASVQTT